MSFEISIDQFEGPLDLMLHLVKENKLDLFDLDVNVLCEQYIAYLNAMDNLHLEIASEYLAELAGLIEYKSKKLLPKEKIEIEEEYEEDQRDKLVKRLLEYQKFKEVSEKFSKTYIQRSKMMEKPVSLVTEEWKKPVETGEYVGDPYDLIKAMNRVIRRYMLNKPLETSLTIKEISVDERAEQIKERLMKLKGKISFEELCDDCNTLHMVIVSFLAILLLIKDGLIDFVIDNRDNIWILKGVKNG